MIGCTPDIWKQDRSEGRGLEIADWLREHPEVTKYAIIDDDNDFLPDQRPNLFRTHWQSGLQDEHVDKIVEHFMAEEKAHVG